MTEYRIGRLGHKGDGVTPDGLFAPLTLPGELITAEATDGCLANIRIVSPSENRVSPPCRHFKSCGGCQLQHASETYLAEWKVEIVRSALAYAGVEAAFHPIDISPASTRRRAGFAARRTKKGALAGFHARASDTVVEIPECKVLDPDLMATTDMLHALALQTASRRETLSVLVTKTLGGLDVSVTGGRPLDRDLEEALAQVAEQHDLARMSWQNDVIALRRPPELKFGQVRVTPPPGAFIQATPEGESALVRRVREIVNGSRRVIDLFSGCGTFTFPVAETSQVHAVEGDPEMVSALETAARYAQGLKQVTAEVRDLFRAPVHHQDLQAYDGAVIDPPRAGAEAQIAELARSGVPVIAYVSCNPITFARDAATLIDAGYHLGKVQVVDQFRWSSHVELVAPFHLNLL